MPPALEKSQAEDQGASERIRAENPGEAAVVYDQHGVEDGGDVREREQAPGRATDGAGSALVPRDAQNLRNVADETKAVASREERQRKIEGLHDV